jgi:hypothetical protein
MGLWYVNVTHFLPSCCSFSVGCSRSLFCIFVLSLCIMEMGYPLALAVCVMLDHSICFRSSLSGNR